MTAAAGRKPEEADGYESIVQSIIRRNSYFSGALFRVALSDALINFHHALGNTEVSLFERIAKHISAKQSENADASSELLASYHQHLEKKRRVFARFLRTHREEHAGSYLICGYDPMNMTKLDNMIYCTHFVMLSENGIGEPLFINGPVLLKMKPGTVNEVTAYII